MEPEREWTKRDLVGEACMAPDAGDGRGIGWAVKQLGNGQAVTRRGWNGRGMSLRLQVPDERSKMSMPYIFITVVGGDRVPWTASQTDLLATDWQFAEV